MGWLETIFRTLLFWLDSIVYKFIPTVYNLLVNIAETSIFSEDVFTLFSNRIYTLLGVFMLFKVSFSILTYVVDPDAFTDKNKGFGKLISNIIITLVLLILTPFIFTYAMELQGIILKDNLIGKLFSTNGVNTTVVADPGNTMAYETFKAFYYFDVDRYPECDSDNFTGNNADFSCIDNISSIEDTASLRKNLEYAHFTGSISVYLDSGIAIMRDSNDNYVMTYTTIFSTITGVVMILLLIVFCFDIAVRSVKLGFLRMLAPVPIISRIDPKKGKEVFDKWVKTCINTYLDLFIRLLAIYFAIFVITQIIDLRFVDAVTGQEMGEVNPFVKVFIILGALMFAKQLPKLISDLTGAKLDGKFTLSPLKKLGEVPLAGGALAAGAVMAGGGALALGRGGANLIGGGLKKGVGTGLSKLSGGRVGTGLMNSGNRTLGNTKTAMQRRWSRSGEEARGRFSASGLLGGEYKGDTAGAMYRKEREELAKKGRQADMDIAEQRSLWDLGNRSNNAVSLDANSTFSDYRRAGFKSEEFIRSLQSIEDNKVRLDLERSNLRQMQYDFEHGLNNVTAQMVAEAEKNYEKAQKAVSSAEENHSKFIAPRHAQDAELEKARKVAKGQRP